MGTAQAGMVAAILFTTIAATPTLALTAACLRARGL